MKSKHFQDAAVDFRYLLNRGYPRKAALEMVGNRYGLNFDERHLLHRATFSDQNLAQRRKKKIASGKIRDTDLAIDGHNVLITIEAGLSGRPLILGDDGFVRDISGLSASFRKSKKTGEALHLIIETLKKLNPHHTLFLFDAPMSQSGELAQDTRERLKKEKLWGDAQAVKVPEKSLIDFPGVVATSDTALIDQSKRVFDLAGFILKKNTNLKPLVLSPHPKRPHSKDLKARSSV